MAADVPDGTSLVGATATATGRATTPQTTTVETGIGGPPPGFGTGTTLAVFLETSLCSGTVAGTSSDPGTASAVAPEPELPSFASVAPFRTTAALPSLRQGARTARQ